MAGNPVSNIHQQRNRIDNGANELSCIWEVKESEQCNEALVLQPIPYADAQKNDVAAEADGSDMTRICIRVRRGGSRHPHRRKRRRNDALPSLASCSSSRTFVVLIDAPQYVLDESGCVEGLSTIFDHFAAHGFVIVGFSLLQSTQPRTLAARCTSKRLVFV